VVTHQKRSGSQVLAYLFAAGLLGMAVSAALYGLDIAHSGETFSVSLFLVISGGLASGLRKEGGARPEDVAVMIAALIFAIWLLGKTFL
jgi:hypothetical protein